MSPSGDLDAGDEVILHEPSFVAYVPAIHLAGGVPARGPPVEDELRGLPAQIEAAITPRTKAIFLGYPNNPTGAVLPDESGSRSPRSRSGTTCWSSPTRSTTGSPTGPRHPAFSALPGHARSDDPDRRLQQGLRDDRLADRLRGRTGADPRRDRQGAPVRDHVRADHAQYAAMERCHRRARRRVDARRVRPSPSTARDGLQRDGPAHLRAARRVLCLPADHATGLDDETFAERLLAEEHVAVVPGERFRPVGRRPRPDVLRDRYEGIDEAMDRMERFVARDSGRIAARTMTETFVAATPAAPAPRPAA